MRFISVFFIFYLFCFFSCNASSPWQDLKKTTDNVNFRGSHWHEFQSDDGQFIGLSKIKVKPPTSSSAIIEEDKDIPLPIAENEPSILEKAYSKVTGKIDDVFAKIFEYPKTSLALAGLTAFTTYGYYYKTDEKFRKKVNAKGEHYYYKFLEEMFNLRSFYLRLNKAPLKTSHLLYGGILYGVGSQAYKLNQQYRFTDSILYVSDFLKEVSIEGLGLIKLSIIDNKNSLKNIGFGLGLGSILMYLYRSVHAPVFQYEEIYNQFINSLSSEQINKIGLINILQTQDNPELLKHEGIYSHLNPDQKKQVINVIREFSYQKKKLDDKI